MRWPKSPRNPSAVGYWGGSPHGRIAAEQIPDKVGVLLVDKILAMGLPFALWREVPPDRPQCSCVTEATRQADRPCAMCYGIGRIGGFEKFGCAYVTAASTDEWALDGVELARDFAPWHLALVAGRTSGTATIGPIQVRATRRLGAWEHDVYAFCRDGSEPVDGGYLGRQSRVVCEWSPDGAAWSPMSQLANRTLTRLYFRVTFSRDTASVASPRFGIVRARFPTTVDVRPPGFRRPRLQEPVIRAIDTWDQDMWTLDQRGIRREGQAKMWTVPLSVFDPSIDRDDNLGARLRDQCFVEQRYGANIGDRYALFGFNYSEQFHIFTRQEFAMRKATSAEIYHKVF